MVPLAPGNGLMLRRVKYGFSDAATLADAAVGLQRWSDTVAMIRGVQADTAYTAGF